MADEKCKTCRRTGQKLFLKGEKCFSHKCPISKKPYPPGKKSKRPKPSSEYGLQLKEKQKLKFSYGLRETQFVNYLKKAMKKGGSDIGKQIIGLLEFRLDNAVYRLGLAQSRSKARQMISHGHICVNNRKTNIPSFQLEKGDKISIRTESLSKKIFTDIDVYLKKYNPPSWLKLDKTKKTGEVIKKTPEEEKLEMDIKINSVIEFYSR
ncbi:30S ribosomal protein S4 [Patescibacteria group bacterium]